MSEVCEERREFRWRTTVNGLSVGEEDQAVQQAEDSVTGLVNRRDDDAPALCDSLQHLDHHESARGVEARRGFVQKQEDGVVDYVRADRDSPSLSAGDSPVTLVSYDGLCCIAQTELVDQSLNSGFLLGLREGARKPELSGEHERLFHSEHGKQEVVLHNVRRDHLQKPRFQDLAV